MFFFHDSQLRKHESIGWIFGERPSQSRCDMFAAVHCQGPEELSMCRACDGPSALHPEERTCIKENIQIF